MKDQIRASILSEIIDELLEDHMISVTEEQLVLNLINELNLPEELLYDQLKRLNLIRTVRIEMERPLSEIDPDIPLVRGEKAYELFDEARLLNERVINRFQRNRIQYRELGYEIDIEGKIIIEAVYIQNSFFTVARCKFSYECANNFALIIIRLVDGEGFKTFAEYIGFIIHFATVSERAVATYSSLRSRKMGSLNAIYILWALFRLSIPSARSWPGHASHLLRDKHIRGQYGGPLP